MLKKLSKIFIILFCLGFLAPQAPGLGSLISIEQAHAQKKKKRKTLFDIIRAKRAKQKAVLKKMRKQSGLKVFKKKKPTKKLAKKKRSKTFFKKKKAVVTRQANLPQKKRKRRKVVVAPVVKVKKSENAAKILVVGDFMAGGLAKGLVNTYAQNAGVVIIDKTSSNSGLVRTDIVDWETALPQYIEEIKPVIVVNFIGINDRQKIKIGDVKEDILSDKWIGEYTKRASALADISKQAKIPMIWVGLPPVKYNNMTRDFLAVNEIFRSITSYAGNIYIDIWDGFSNEQGKYVSSGPDVNGHIVKLRGSKGISMTSSGRAKLAFYVEKDLKKFGYPARTNSKQNLIYANFPSYGKPLQDQKSEKSSALTGTTSVLPLGTAKRRNSLYLEGEPEFLKAADKDKSVSYDLVEKGKFYKPREGRIDAGWGQSNAPQTAEDDAKTKTGENKKVNGDKQTQNLTPANDNAAQTNSQTIAN